MDVRLFQAALRGEVSLLTKLLQEDPQLLDRALHACSAKNNPLHIAARLGHLDFTTEILTHKPQFARELNSQGQTPLHLASAKGHLKVVKVLREACPDACYLYDKDGTAPLHRAAMNGRVEVLKLLVDADMETAWLLTDQGVPVLHLCVHHNQFEAFEALVDAVCSVEFVNLKDDVDNTILHLLAAKNEYEVIESLLKKNKGVDVNVMNVDGLTAQDVSSENCTGINRWKIWAILKSHKAKKGKKRGNKIQNEKYEKWSNKMKESLIVVAILMASITFQAALNPPGGVLQEDKGNHKAGHALISLTCPLCYKIITVSNALGLVASVSLILLLVSGFSFQRKISIWLLIITTWMAVTSIMITYIISLISLTPREMIVTKAFIDAILSWVVWVGLLCIVLSVHLYRLLKRLLIYFSSIVPFPLIFQSVAKLIDNLDFKPGATEVEESRRVEANP